MAEKLGIPADASSEQLNVIIGVLYLSLAHAVEHIAKTESLSSVVAFKGIFLTA